MEKIEAYYFWDFGSKKTQRDVIWYTIIEDFENKSSLMKLINQIPSEKESEEAPFAFKYWTAFKYRFTETIWSYTPINSTLSWLHFETNFVKPLQKSLVNME